MSNGVIHEPELTIPTLTILAKSPGGFLSTTDLIAELEAHFKPTGKDSNILQGRNDTHFSQKVRNMISHRGASTSPIYRGLIEYDEGSHGLRITDAGRRFLDRSE